MSTLNNLRVGDLIDNKWKITKFLGEGACAKVFSVKHVDSSKQPEYPVVAKCVWNGTGLKGKAKVEQERICATLNKERTLLAPGQTFTQFEMKPRLPRQDYYGKDPIRQCNYLILEQFEMTLDNWATSTTVTHSKLADIGVQLLRGLKWLHEKGFVFLDVKPDNFMTNGDDVKFIDYGLVEKYLSHTSSGYRDNIISGFAGTPGYCSLAVHQGNVPTPKDDVEAMCYVLLSLMDKNGLPWMTSKSDTECLQLKKSFNITKYCIQCNVPQIAEIIEICRSLEYGENVNYADIRELLEEMAKNTIKRSSSQGARSPLPSNKRSKVTTVEVVEIEPNKENIVSKKKTPTLNVQTTSSSSSSSSLSTNKKINTKKEEIITIDDSSPHTPIKVKNIETIQSSPSSASRKSSRLATKNQVKYEGYF